MSEIKKYRVYKICPECNHFYADYWVEMNKKRSNIDYTNIAESTITFTQTKHFKCRSCGHHRVE